MLFATATDWVTRLTEAHRAGRLPQELTRLGRYGLIIIDEVGYLPFEQDAAKLYFQLVSSRYEHASLVLTSNLPFSGWGGVFGDQAVAAAIDRPDRPSRRRTSPTKVPATGFADEESTASPASTPPPTDRSLQTPDNRSLFKRPDRPSCSAIDRDPNRPHFRAKLLLDVACQGDGTTSLP